MKDFFVQHWQEAIFIVIALLIIYTINKLIATAKDEDDNDGEGGIYGI